LTDQNLEVSARVTFRGVVSPTAQSRLQDAVQKYTENLAARVHEIEERERAAGVINPEITASTVVKAEAALRERGTIARVSMQEIALRIAAPIFSGGAGVTGSYLHSLLQAVAFGVVTAIAVMSTLMLIFKDVK
jgi:hypothetical protein